MSGTESAHVARRRFAIEDQVAFAELSGDWNPVHVDPVAARRTMFGAPVVHGVHLVLWSLEQWLRPGPGARLDSVRATFRKPAYLDEEIVLTAETTDNRTRLVAASRSGTVAEIVVELGPGLRSDTALDRSVWPNKAPVELSAVEASRARGSVTIAIACERAASAFPAICERVGVACVAELAAMTRLVGMECPGMHSVLSSLALRARTELAGDAVHYEVANANLKYSMISLRVTGGAYEGTLDTFVRPQPARTDMAAALQTVDPASFASQRALVIGGSRGIGEAIAKVIAAGGGDVVFTYHRGITDAARVADEITACGRVATAIELDVLAPIRLRDHWPRPQPPTHLYYCATPTLYAIRKGAAFDLDELDLMFRYFVTAFHQCVAAVVALGCERLVVWTPSTTMLDAPVAGVGYCIAKAAMEELCRHLPSLFPVTVHAPRLGRVETDQTASLMQISGVSALDVALDQLKQFRS